MSTPTPPAEPVDVRLSKPERLLIAAVRGLQFGIIEIKVQDGVPVLVAKVRENIKLV